MQQIIKNFFGFLFLVHSANDSLFIMSVKYLHVYILSFFNFQKRCNWWYVWSAERSGWLKDPDAARYGTRFGKNERTSN